MDSQTTLIEMLAYLRDGEWLDAQEMLANLLQWHKRKGFTPDLKTALDALVQDEKLFRLYSGEDEHGC